MKSCIPLLLILTVFIIANCPCLALAQNDTSVKSDQIILKSSWGNQRWLDVSYVYTTHLISIAYHRQIRQGHKLDIFLYIRPQYGKTKYLNNLISSIEDAAHEYGLGIGGRIAWKIYNRGVGLFLDAETGPHFISEPLERQVSGFLFSNHISFGASYQWREQLFIEIATGFRHMSNAETRLPNGGLNNVFFSVGIGLKL